MNSLILNLTEGIKHFKTNVFILSIFSPEVCTLCVHSECLFYLIKDLRVLGNIKVAHPHKKSLWTEEMQMANHRMNGKDSKSETDSTKINRHGWRQRSANENEDQLNKSTEYE